MGRRERGLLWFAKTIRLLVMLLCAGCAGYDPYGLFSKQTYTEPEPALPPMDDPQIGMTVQEVTDRWGNPAHHRYTQTSDGETLVLMFRAESELNILKGNYWYASVMFGPDGRAVAISDEGFFPPERNAVNKWRYPDGAYERQRAAMVKHGGAGTIPDDVSFSIINSGSIPGESLGLDVFLNKPVPENVIAAIARKLKEESSGTYPKIFMDFYLPGMEVGKGTWATASFSPGLTVQISGAEP